MATQVPTSIQITDFSTKWGLVTVANPDGSINREYTITGAQADAVVKNNKTVPSGCTSDEWFSGRVMVATKPCNVGQAVINPDGSLIVNYGVSKVSGRIQAALMKCFPTEYSVVTGVLYLNSDIATQVVKPFQLVTSLIL